MQNASPFRKHAQDCRDLADTLSSGEARELLRDKAHHWDTLADLVEGAEFPPAPGPKG